LITEISSHSSVLCSSHYDDDFGAFEKYTTVIGLKMMRKMGYKGKGLGANGQGIVKPIQVVELPRYVRLGYVREEYGAFSKTIDEINYKTID
jgi:hypothetical protein